MPRYCENEDAVIIYDLPASSVTTFKGGGTIEKTIFPKNAEAVLKYAPECDFILGRGSNLIISDGLKKITAISLKLLNRVTCSGNRIIAEAGVMAKNLLNAAVKNSLSGLEFLHRIPGSVGGLVKMNAGAFGQQISDTLESCLVLQEGCLKEVKPDFGYRTSNIDGIVLSATFSLFEEKIEVIEDRIRNNCIKRIASQPSAPSCGSVFKNPPSFSAGKLIEECGFKGFKIGGAEVSRTHCNFIVNTGGATADDFLQIVDKIEKTVYYKYGIRLEREFKLLD
ncbi:MAG: UDP-N-acetylmuramate dehydrogenase [Christensenellales bacterium]